MSMIGPGQTVGARYHVIRLLGIGGMGAVYHAWDAELGVAVALKVIRTDVSGDPDATAAIERQFKQELLLARQVTHKHVVRIHDLGDIDGVKYITMPYVQGADMATVLKQAGKLPIPRTLKYLRQIVDGLVAAHDAGVVHRDLKPANIMIDEEDQALIMDFGIARSSSQHPQRCLAGGRHAGLHGPGAGAGEDDRSAGGRLCARHDGARDARRPHRRRWPAGARRSHAAD